MKDCPSMGMDYADRPSNLIERILCALNRANSAGCTALISSNNTIENEHSDPVLLSIDNIPDFRICWPHGLKAETQSGVGRIILTWEGFQSFGAGGPIYWKPRLAAKARIERARIMCMIWTTPKITETIKSSRRKLWSITEAILTAPTNRVEDDS
jgi:hypothetical protein